MRYYTAVSYQLLAHTINYWLSKYGTYSSKRVCAKWSMQSGKTCQYRENYSDDHERVY